MFSLILSVFNPESFEHGQGLNNFYISSDLGAPIVPREVKRCRVFGLNFSIVCS